MATPGGSGAPESSIQSNSAPVADPSYAIDPPKAGDMLRDSIAAMSTPPTINISFDQIVAARDRIADGMFRTPCAQSLALSELTGCRVHSKLEYLQPTGSFKERGARNALMQLDDTARKRGVVAASAGNHGLAIAYHGRELGIPVTVVMPRFAPMIKQVRCRRMDARVMLHGNDIAEARVRADELAETESLTYIHGFNDAPIIAGQGTIGLEIIEQAPKMNAVIVPVGGAGLIAGVGLAIKTARPDVELIGVEPEHAASFAMALDAGKPVACPMKPTLADGLAVPTVGPRAFEIARRHVDRMITVNEEQIALAILRLAELEKGVVEGAGATALAALMSGRLDHLKGKHVVLLLCGGNIDPTILSRVIEHGLTIDGRLTQFTAVIPDRPGGLAELTQTVAATGASIKQIDHERTFSGADVFTVQVLCTVETNDAAHIERLHAALKEAGIRVVARTAPGTCTIADH